MVDAQAAGHSIGILGGSGREGRGLAVRLALAGHPVVLGSRDAARAAEAAAEVTDTLGARSHAPVRGDANAAAATADVVIVAVPYAAHAETLTTLRDELAGRLVIDAVVPLGFDGGVHGVAVAAGSATEEAAALLPLSRVAGAFHNIPAEGLRRPDVRLDADVLVVADDHSAKAQTLALVSELAGLRPVDAGPLRFARYVEGLTVLLIDINRRHRVAAAPRLVGLPDPTAGAPQ